MQGFKSQAAQKPTAMGSLLQSSSYGSAIPVVWGQTQSPLLAIWAANLRQGGGTKKFKQFKKGITNYVENIDFLLGHTPMRGVLQVMVNGGLYPLTFTSHSFTASAGAGSYEVTDAAFYFVTAVTLTVDYSFETDDYGGQGEQTLTGSYEIPLWNELETGPDPSDPMSYRCWPFCYRWQPGFGATVYIDPQSFPGGTLKVYYAQLTDATSFQPPLTKLNLAFENQLGSGNEYSEAPSPFDEQQIIYPHFAGCGGAEVDLGAAGALPQITPEVAGKWGVYPTGDADFADMIEDIFKSGLAQAAIGAETATTQMERGLSSYDMPGTIQKKIDASDTASLPPMLYDMPNAPGNFLVCAVTGAGALAISSTAGDIWAPVYASSLGYQVWYAVAAGGQNTVTVSGASEPWQMALMEINGVGQLLPVPDVPPTPGLTATSLATTNTPVQSGTGSGVGLASSTDTTGDMSITITGGLFQECEAGVTWSDFAVPTLPGDAVVTAVQALVTIEASLNGGTNVASIAGITTGAIPTGTVLGANIYTGDLAATIASFAPFILLGNSGGDGPPFTTTVTVSSISLLVSYTSASNPGVSGILDSIGTVASSANGSIVSTTQPGFPAYLLAIALYGSAEAPAAAPNARWKPVTPANFYGQATTTMQMHERVVYSPGTYSISEVGPTPASLLLFAFKATQPVSYPRPLGDFIDLPSLDLTRAQCRANGLYGSLSMNSQSAASDWLKSLYQGANAAPVFLGSKLFSFPYSEVSAAGNGCTYTAPTAAGPIANLDADNGDFVGDGGCPKLTTVSRVGLPNVLQMQCVDRSANYNQVVVDQPDAASIALYGQRKSDPIVNNAIQDPSIARCLLGIQIRRTLYGGDTYAFTASARWCLLAPMDLITITDRLQNIVTLPVRIESYEEQEDGSFQAVARPFVYGMNAPTALSVTSPVVNPTGITVSAGDVNPPIVFEPVPRLYANGPQAQLWVVVSSPSANYGGCQVFVSTDGGDSYNPLGDPLLGSAITGALTAGWPASTTPDTTNDLSIDLTESEGELQSYAVSDEDNFLYPCYVEGADLLIESNGTSVASLSDLSFASNATVVAGPSLAFNYELMTYATAVLTAANQYTLKATGSGNHLNRAVFGAPGSAGISHSTGNRFAFLNPSGTGILKVNMDEVWVGVELFIKIVSFNQFGTAAQSLADVPAYSYTPTGVPATV